jgi:hypothetical protein
MRSKFYKKPTLKERLVSLKYSILFWKGRKKGMIHTRDITWKDIRVIFYPKTFYEKFIYLGAIPYKEEMSMIHALVIAMDYEARPWWCPRWFLRFLHLFGNDNSLVRVRNFRLNRLHTKITKGVFMWDYKTKWQWYDLRISITAPEYLSDLSKAIEQLTYDKGEREDLYKEIRRFEPDFKVWKTNQELRQYLDTLYEKENNE